MKQRKIFMVALTLGVLVLMVGQGAAAPTKIWEDTVTLGSGNVYYGNVIGGNYFVGKIDGGLLEYNSAGLVNSLDTGAGTAKSLVQVGNNLYFSSSASSGGLYYTSGFSGTRVGPMTNADGSANGNPEALTTDGTHIFSNSYTGSGKNPIVSYTVNPDFTLTTNWSLAITGASRIRGISYYDGDGGKIYVADGAAGKISEVNADGSGFNTIISSIPGFTGNLYQAVRNGNSILAVGDNGNLYTFANSGGSWNLTSTDNLGMSALYGIGLSDDGNSFWVSATGNKVGYFAVPEPISMILLAVGGILGLRKRS